MSVMHPISVKQQVQHWGTGVFQLDATEDGFKLELVHGGAVTLVATCANGKALAKWATEKGAPVVKWTGDACILSDRRME